MTKYTLKFYYLEQLEDLTKFMYSCDTITKSTAIVKDINRFIVEVSFESDNNYLKLSNINKIYKLAINSSSTIFIDLLSVNGKLISYKKMPPYIKQGINKISTGKEWCSFKNFLETLGYKVETNKQLEITKITESPLIINFK